MKTVLKRLLAVVLTLVMVISSVPMTAFSAELDITFSEVSKILNLENVDDITSSDKTIYTLIRISNGLRLAIGVIFILLLLFLH